MSSRYRRPRGTPTVPLNMFVAPDVKKLIDSYAARANVPQWAIVEAAIRAGQPGKNGVPTGWDLPDSEALPGLTHGGEPVQRAG